MQPLSAKESSLFRQVIRNYEDKQYKKGLCDAAFYSVEHKLTMYRYQSCRTDPEEESETWRYSGNESPHYELAREDG